MRALQLVFLPPSLSFFFLFLSLNCLFWIARTKCDETWKLPVGRNLSFVWFGVKPRRMDGEQPCDTLDTAGGSTSLHLCPWLPHPQPLPVKVALQAGVSDRGHFTHMRDFSLPALSPPDCHSWKVLMKMVGFPGRHLSPCQRTTAWSTQHQINTRQRGPDLQRGPRGWVRERAGWEEGPCPSELCSEQP